MNKVSHNNTNQHRLGRKRHLWLWFVAGFLIVFLGLSLTITMYPMHPSGNAVVACKLWKYYLLEIQRAWHSSGHLGPATGSSSAAVTTALQHFLFSAVGGAVMLGVGGIARKIKYRKRGAAQPGAVPDRSGG